MLGEDDHLREKKRDFDGKEDCDNGQRIKKGS